MIPYTNRKDLGNLLYPNSISNRLPVVIFGAGVIGELTYYACHFHGIDCACFCDNDPHKWGKEVCGFPVIAPDELKKKYKDASILISTTSIGDIVKQLTGLGYNQWYSCSWLLYHTDFTNYPVSISQDFIEYYVNGCLLSHDSFLSPELLFFKNVEIIITERCSLKCRDCANLMQYYKSPKDCDFEILMQSIDRFFSYVDHVYEFRVLGGEPLLSKHFSHIIDRLVCEKKLDKVIIYTNGTIVPSDLSLRALQNKKVFVYITDYGKLSRKISELVELFNREHIIYCLQKVQGWTDCSKIVKHQRTTDDLNAVFNACCAKDLFTLSDGELHRCPFSANASRLRAIPFIAGDSVNLLDTRISHEEMIRRIREFSSKQYIGACDYCNGRPFGAPTITPAIQIRQPLYYESQNQTEN